MRIGFTGAHRSGKTTLAKEVAKAINAPMIETKTSSNEVWNQVKGSPADWYPWHERVRIQKEVWKGTKDTFDSFQEKTSKVRYVTDRTFVDITAYLLCNIDDSCSSLYDSEMNQFVGYSLSSHMMTYFDWVFVVGPDISFEELPGKSGKTFNSEPYLESLHHQCVGLVHAHCPCFSVIPRSVSSLEKRTQFVLDTVFPSSKTNNKHPRDLPLYPGDTVL